MEIVWNHRYGGPPELKREDGWFYRLHGIGAMEATWSYDDHCILEVTIFDLSDRTLDSIRVLRDNFTHMGIRINHDY